MYPDQQPPQYSVDYLNQIATPQQNTGVPKNMKLIIIIGLVLLIASFIIIVMGILGSKEEPTSADLAIRLETLEMVSRDTHENLSSGDLRSINSNLTLALTNASRDMNTFLGEDVAKAVQKQAKENPEGAELTKTFSDADLNAVISRTYPREMTYQLDVTLLLLQDLYNESSNAKYKEFLSKTYNDLEPIKESLEAFNQD